MKVVMVKFVIGGDCIKASSRNNGVQSGREIVPFKLHTIHLGLIVAHCSSITPNNMATGAIHTTNVCLAVSRVLDNVFHHQTPDSKVRPRRNNATVMILYG